MNRSKYFNYIEEKLEVLARRIEKRGKINLLDLNIYSETFFAELMNLLFGLTLVNMNILKQNVEGIDLVDVNHKVVVQVSSTCTKQKIEGSLNKDIFRRYSGYRFIFVSIAKDATKLRDKSFINPHNAAFSPTDDIVDINTLLNVILSMEIDKQREVFEFVKKELGDDVDLLKVDTNLATIINILANENLANCIESPEINSFEIDKKITFNDLSDVKDTIDDYKIFYQKLDEKYAEFDREGSNKSFSVFQIIKKQYTMHQHEKANSKELFYSIIDNITKIIIESKNYIEIPYEELELCVCILVVDAFIRCKIFKNPEGYSHVIAG